MRPKIKNYKTINPEQWYTIADISRLGRIGIFPIKDKKHLKHLIETKRLKAIDIGTKSRKAFRVMGNTLLEFISGNNIKKE